MIDPRMIQGLIKRPDGYWLKTPDGTLHSICPERAERMLKHIQMYQTDWQDQYIREDIKYLLIAIKHHIHQYIYGKISNIRQWQKGKKK